MRRLAAFNEYLKERLEDTRPAEVPEPLPYTVPVPELLGQCSPRMSGSLMPVTH